MSASVRERRLAAVVERALELGRHWNDQEGANAAVIDALAEAVRLFEEADVDDKLARRCREWRDGRIDREAFLSSVNGLLEGERRNFEPLPLSVVKAQFVVRAWENGVCPDVANTALACAWTCADCKKQRPATRTSRGDLVPGIKCARWRATGEER